MKKTIFTAISLLCFGLGNAQEENTKKTYLKANALFAPIGMINVAAEFQLNEKYTIQPEVFVSPWKSFAGKYAQIYMIGVDGRYYFNESFKNWYIGANLSFARYKAQKWGYWKDEPYQYDENSPIYTASDLYQDGYSIFIGAVAGYQFSIGKRWNMDLYLGAGNAQSFYKGYHKELGVCYEDPNNTGGWDRSGEWIPYKGGVMISYQLK